MFDFSTFHGGDGHDDAWRQIESEYSTILRVWQVHLIQNPQYQIVLTGSCTPPFRDMKIVGNEYYAQQVRARIANLLSQLALLYPRYGARIASLPVPT
jgi:hypothetical protein